MIDKEFAHYVGGPMDGQTRRRRRGRPKLYLHDDGSPMRPELGDRIFGLKFGKDRSKVKTGYAFQEEWELDTSEPPVFYPQHRYVHSSAIAGHRAARAAAWERFKRKAIG